MTMYYYEFQDGYFCWTVGKLSAADLRAHDREHGKVVCIKNEKELR